MAFIKSKKTLITILFSAAVLLSIILIVSPAVSCRAFELEGNATPANADHRDLSGADKLIVGSDTSYPPFGFLNEQGDAEGFDVEIIKEIGQRLGKEIEIKPLPFDSLYRELDEGGIDLIISALTVTEDKKTAVDYSETYYQLEYLLLSLSDAEIRLKEEMEGQMAGILNIDKGCMAEELLSKYKVTEYDDIKVMIENLKAGGIEGMIVPRPIAINILGQDGKMYRVLDTFKSSREFVIAMRKNSGIKEDIDRIIEEMNQDGTLTEIYDRWFSLD
ncbi:MAG: ABC transporter substrate-binding protein [Actinomycetota bacterium]